MDEATQIHLFVTEFVNQMARMHKGIIEMRSWYIFTDKRPGTILVRLDADAKRYNDYERMKRP